MLHGAVKYHVLLETTGREHSPLDFPQTRERRQTSKSIAESRMTPEWNSKTPGQISLIGRTW